MGKADSSARSTRKRPLSCHFCRSRKLRCNRQSPCANCESRGIRCTLYSTNAVETPIVQAPAQGTTSNGANPELMARLLRLEEVVLKHSDHAFTRTPPIHRPWQTSALTTFIPPADGDISSKIEADVLTKVSFNEDWFVSSSYHACLLSCISLMSSIRAYQKFIDIDLSTQCLL